ncbi:cupin domain-containing protein [Arthrobacter zhaoguopingii]|uniref:cupin domain-containing protein n=1 Tax=Arthrobacter zhaoguopingii TaxID=2681491 RepID=UPI001356FDF3|nr:cupin domain-containing protein [Arthrobacter zhaoguopingii]
MSQPAVPVITRHGQEDTSTAQSGGAVRVSGVGPQHTPATRIWFGKVSNRPGYRSLPHHHGEAETGGYVLKGHGRIYYGHNYQQFEDLEEGDFVFVPPFMPHIEVNLSGTEELTWLTTRTPDNIVVNLEDVADGLLPDWPPARQGEDDRVAQRS